MCLLLFAEKQCRPTDKLVVLCPLQVAEKVYEHVAFSERYDDLRSTRHFGGMTFYFVWDKRIDGLLMDMLQRELYVALLDTYV